MHDRISIYWEFQVSDLRIISQLTIVNGTKETYNRVEKWTPNQEDLTSFIGDYWSDELETVYHLVIKDDKLTIKHRWNDDIVLDAISKDSFKTDWGYFVKFIRNPEDEISGLSINSGRTLNVVFHRRE